MPFKVVGIFNSCPDTGQTQPPVVRSKPICCNWVRPHLSFSWKKREFSTELETSRSLRAVYQIPIRIEFIIGPIGTKYLGRSVLDSPWGSASVLGPLPQAVR